MTQNGLILNHLQTYGSITSKEVDKFLVVIKIW